MVINNTNWKLYLPNGYYINMIKNMLAEYMLEKDIEKRDITKLTKMDRHVLNRIYKKKTKSITFDNLNKLCFALDCTPNDLFRYVPDEN